jgi:hypothetical protein
MRSDRLHRRPEAAELIADMSAAFVADDPEDRARVAFWEARLDVAWRTLLLVEPSSWPT